MGLQYGIKEVMNVGFLDYATKNPFLYADYATVSTNEIQGERTFISGGQGNFRLMAFDHSKTATLKMNFPLVDMNMLAMLAGDSLISGASTVYMREVLTVSSGSVTLSQTPVGSSISVFALQGVRDNGTAYTKVASAPTSSQYTWTTGTNTVGFNTSENGKKVVVWYQYNTSTSAQSFRIKTNKFPKMLTIFGEGLFRDQETDLDRAVRATFFKAKPQSNFTLTMESTNTTNLEITFDLFADKDSQGDYSYAEYVLL